MNQKLTFTELVEKIANETGAARQLIHNLLLDEVQLVKEDLKRDGVATIHGLGHFRLTWHKARPGHNPQTGEEIEIPAHSSVNFKTQADLGRYINRQYDHLKPQMVKGDVQNEGDKTIISKPIESEIAPEYEPYPEKGKKKKRSRFWIALFLLIFIIIILFVIIRTCTEKPGTKLSKSTVSKKVKEKETVLPQAAEKIESPITEDKIRIGTPGSHHTVIPGDNLWKISSRYYTQGELWPNIYRANLNQISNPDVLIPDSRILVPDLIGKPGAWTRKDVEDISAGFIEAYLFYKNRNRTKALNCLWVVHKWDATQVIAKYHSKINSNDLESVKNIPGTPRIK